MDESVPDATSGTGESVAGLRNTVAIFLQIDDISLLTGISPIVIEKLTVKANEFESLKSQHLLDEVAFRNSLRSSNEKLKLLGTRLEVAEKDANSLRSVNEETVKSRIEADHKCQLLETKNNELLERVSSLKQRVEQLGAEKLEGLQNLERKSSEIKELRKEVDDSRNQLLDAKRSLVDFMNEAQLAKSTLSSSKIRQQNLEQELELLKRNNEWLDNELKKKSEEFRLWRSERSTRITELESELDTLKANHSALQQSFNNTKERLSSISEKYDEQLIKFKDLQTAEAAAKEEFRAEMADQRRKGEIWEKTAKDAIARVEELEGLLANERKRDGSSVSKWRNEAEKYRQKAEKLQKQLVLLEEQFTADLSNNTTAVSSNVQTPVARKGEPFTPSRNANSSNVEVFSPSAKVISEIQKNGGSLVKLYSDFQEVKLRLDREKHKNEQLRMEMDRILEEMEAHAPSILAEREDNQRLESELAGMSVRLSNTLTSLEKAEASFKDQSIKLRDTERENSLLSQHVQDLARQVQQLLIQNKLLSDNDDIPLNPDEYDILQRLLSGQKVDIPEKETEVTGFNSDTQKIISSRMVLFKDIVDLQKQNSDLLNVVRQLGKELEEKEVAVRKAKDDNDAISMDTIAETIENLESRLKQKESLVDQLQHERDIFRKMVASKNSNGDHGTDVPSSASDSVYIQQLIKQLEKASAELDQIKEEFNTYKEETSITVKQLNSQLTEASQARSELQMKVYSAKGSADLASERFKNASEDLELARKETAQLRQRNQDIQDNLFKQDLRTQQVTEELIQARSKIESIQSEAANLKAEKSLWKSIEERLSKENSELLEERGRLNGILTNIQVMESEREARSAESQRQLLSQIETLNSQVASLEKRLEQEQSEVRKISERREIEVSSAQAKNDKLTSSLSVANEELVKYKTQSTQLDSRIQDLTILLASAEEKLKIYQSSAESGTSLEDSETSLREEVASLKAEIKLKENELQHALDHNKQLTDLATASEDGIKNMSETVEEFESDMKGKLAAKDSEIAKLQGELSIIRGELDSAKSQLNNGQSELTERLATLEAEKTQLESSVNALKDSEAHLREVEANLKSDADTQRAIAQSAHDNYEQEVVKHGQTTNVLQQVRSEYSKLKEEAIELSSKTKQSIQALENAEASWANQRYVLEHEIEELKSRFDDASSQNKVLLAQLEQLTSDHVAARPLSNLSAASTENEEAGSASSEVEMYVGEIGYLKRQMEFVEEKYEASSQEVRRLKQRLEHTTSTLDELKAELEAQRLKSGSSLEADEKEHQRIMSQLTDLNVLRESNDSLRQQSQYYSKKCEELERKVEELTSKIGPLEEQLRQSVAESEAKDQQIALIKKDSEYWKERTHKILQKTEQVDVNEFIKSKALVEELEKEKKQLNDQLGSQKLQLEAEYTKQRTELEGELSKAKAELETLAGRFNSLKKESQDKLQKRRAENLQLKEELAKAKAELEEVRSAVESANAKAVETAAAADAANTSANAASATDASEALTKLKEEHDVVIQEKEKRIGELVEQINQVSDEVIDLQQLVKTYEEKGSKIDELEQANQQLKNEVEELKRGVAQGSSADPVTIPDADVSYQAKIEELENNHKENLARVDKEREEWKANMRAKFTDTLKQQRQKDEERVRKALEEAKSQQDSAGGVDSERVKELETKLAELEAKHKEELASTVEKTREMVLKESGMRMTLLQNKASKLEKELTALKGGEGTTTKSATVVHPPVVASAASSGSRLPVFNRSNLAKPKIASNESAEAQSGDKRPLEDASNDGDAAAKKLKEDAGDDASNNE